MKQILGFVMLAACTLGMSSCEINHSQYSEDIIPWVYDNALYPNYVYIQIDGEIELLFREQRDKEFVDEYKYLEDKNEYSAFCELAHIVKNEQSVKTVLTSKDGYGMSLFEKRLLNNDYTEEAAEYYNGLFLTELNVTIENITNYWSPWEEFLNEYKISSTEILDQGLDESNLGDKYTGYYVVYALTGYFDEVKYALVSITEYDDDSRYEYQILATADSLKEINQYLE